MTGAFRTFSGDAKVTLRVAAASSFLKGGRMYLNELAVPLPVLELELQGLIPETALHT